MLEIFTRQMLLFTLNSTYVDTIEFFINVSSLRWGTLDIFIGFAGLESIIQIRRDLKSGWIEAGGRVN